MVATYHMYDQQGDTDGWSVLSAFNTTEVLIEGWTYEEWHACTEAIM